MKNLFLSLAWIYCWIPLYLLNANILYVPSNYSTIQSAINSSVNGDTVLVSPGIYYENIFFYGKGILLSSLFLLNNDTSYISSTVINGSNPVKPDSASTVMMTMPNMSSAEDSSAVLMGFTITGGHGVVWDDVLFPGSYYREGGGLLIQNWSPRIRYNRIIGNNIYDSTYPNGGGGGIHYGNGKPIIENNIIQNNKGYCGMGICIYGAGGIVRNNIIAGNYGGQAYGCGAIYTYSNYQSSLVIIENNTVVNNSAYSGTGGLRLYHSNFNVARNNIVWGNVPSQIYVSECTPVITYSDIQNGYTGNGNVNLNPGFTNNSFSLSATSPCVDAGDTGISFRDPEDPLHPGMALYPALGTVRNDMGAYGGQHCSVLGSYVIGVQKTGISKVVTEYVLRQNYPNPFNSTTNIKFQIAKSSFVSLKIYDALGKEIAVLVKEKLSPGEYQTVLNCDKFSSGIYFYKLIAGYFMEIKKMVLLK